VILEVTPIELVLQVVSFLAPYGFSPFMNFRLPARVSLTLGSVWNLG